MFSFNIPSIKASFPEVSLSDSGRDLFALNSVNVTIQGSFESETLIGNDGPNLSTAMAAKA